MRLKYEFAQEFCESGTDEDVRHKRLRRLPALVCIGLFLHISCSVGHLKSMLQVYFIFLYFHWLVSFIPILACTVGVSHCLTPCQVKHGYF